MNPSSPFVEIQGDAARKRAEAASKLEAVRLASEQAVTSAIVECERVQAEADAELATEVARRRELRSAEAIRQLGLAHREITEADYGLASCRSFAQLYARLEREHRFHVGEGLNAHLAIALASNYIAQFPAAVEALATPGALTTHDMFEKGIASLAHAVREAALKGTNPLAIRDTMIALDAEIAAFASRPGSRLAPGHAKAVWRVICRCLPADAEKAAITRLEEIAARPRREAEEDRRALIRDARAGHPKAMLRAERELPGGLAGVARASTALFGELSGAFRKAINFGIEGERS